MTDKTYTPATAEDFLLELSDEALVDILDGPMVASRKSAHEAVSTHVARIFGEEPDADVVARVVDTLLAYEVISAPIAA